MPSKKQAKMAAALKACERLHEIGELDDDLLPKRTSSDEESDLEEEAAAESGGKKTKSWNKEEKATVQEKGKQLNFTILACDLLIKLLTYISQYNVAGNV